MIRMIISSAISFFLLMLESFFVMKIKGLETIDYGGVGPFINVWAMNFFFVFSIMTHIYFWQVKRGDYDEFTE